jgi:hypothetical protein
MASGIATLGKRRNSDVSGWLGLCYWRTSIYQETGRGATLHPGLNRVPLRSMKEECPPDYKSKRGTK